MKTFNETINCANDDNLKERFEITWRKRQINEGYLNTFNTSNKDHAKIYNMFLETYMDIAQNLGPAERYKLIPSILEQLAEDIKCDDGKGQLEYLAEAIDTQNFKLSNLNKTTKELIKEIDPSGKSAKETGNIGNVEKYSFVERGGSLNKEAISDDKSIEALQKQLCAIEKKIEMLFSRKRNLIASNPLNDTKHLDKDLDGLIKQAEKIKQTLGKFDKDSQKIELN